MKFTNASSSKLLIGDSLMDGLTPTSYWNLEGNKHWKTSNLNKGGGDVCWPYLLYGDYLALLLVTHSNHSVSGRK